MLVQIPNVISHSGVKQIREILDASEWVDGKVTAGEQSGAVKNNKQLDETSPVAKEVGGAILAALSQNNTFVSAALPSKIFPPLFNSYSEGEGFGTHIDNAIRLVSDSHVRIRTDLSATLFLSDPSEYDGGELVIEDHYGIQNIKLNEGDMVLYPSTSRHHVTKITRGVRVSSFFWLQSMVRDNEHRSLLFDLDQSVQQLGMERGLNDTEVVRLSGIYHNLVRQWADI